MSNHSEAQSETVLRQRVWCTEPDKDNQGPKADNDNVSPAVVEAKTQQKDTAAFQATAEAKMQEKEAPTSPATAEAKMQDKEAPTSPATAEAKMQDKEAPTSPATAEAKMEEKEAPASPATADTKMQEKEASPATSEAEVQQQGLSAEDEVWLKAIEAKFSSIAGQDGMISYEEFKNAIDSKAEIFVKSYFKLFDEDGSGEIAIDEFMESLRKISQQSDLDKLRFLFSIFDTDGNGEITPEELKVALRACITESSLKMTDDKMDQLVGALMKAADTDGDGVITFPELKTQFEKYPMLLENLAVSPSNWLKLHQKPVKPSVFEETKKAAINMYNNNMPLLVFLVIHHIIFLLCILQACLKYRRANRWVILARTCGMSLNYHSALLALSMARRSLTFLRNTPIGPYLAVDDHIELHKMLGAVTVVLGIGHTVGHLANIGVMVAGGHALSFAQILFTHLSGIGFFYGTAYPSGVILTIILVIMGFCSSPYIRRAGLFEFFYRTHLLYIPYWAITLLHGPIFWKFFLVPGLMIFCEHCYSHYLSHRQKMDTKLFTTEVNLLPSRVIHLVVTRPDNFKFNAADYVFIRLPLISNWEWHPFSISSAPEEEEVLWIHIRTETGWTKRLYDFFDTGEYLNRPDEPEEEASEGAVQEVKRRQLGPPESLPNGGKSYKYRTKCYIEGPFGSAAVRMGDTNHAVLVAGGIGVTPFASVLQSLVTKHREAQATKAGDQPRYADSNRLKKIDFIWVNRKADEFDWFLSLLTQLEMEETRQGDFDDFLDMHLFMTAAKSSSDLKGVGLQMALELVHQEDSKDMVTGLKTRTQAGRPNWIELFDMFKAQNHGQVHVYFCGSPHLAGVVKSACDTVGIKFSLSL